MEELVKHLPAGAPLFLLPQQRLSIVFQNRPEDDCVEDLVFWKKHKNSKKGKSRGKKRTKVGWDSESVLKTLQDNSIAVGAAVCASLFLLWKFVINKEEEPKQPQGVADENVEENAEDEDEESEDENEVKSGSDKLEEPTETVQNNTESVNEQRQQQPTTTKAPEENNDQFELLNYHTSSKTFVVEEADSHYFPTEEVKDLLSDLRKKNYGESLPRGQRLLNMFPSEASKLPCQKYRFTNDNYVVEVSWENNQDNLNLGPFASGLTALLLNSPDLDQDVNSTTNGHLIYSVLNNVVDFCDELVYSLSGKPTSLAILLHSKQENSTYFISMGKFFLCSREGKSNWKVLVSPHYKGCLSYSKKPRDELYSALGKYKEKNDELICKSRFWSSSKDDEKKHYVVGFSTKPKIKSRSSIFNCGIFNCGDGDSYKGRLSNPFKDFKNDTVSGVSALE
eukprot:GHVP01021754.1.p1 GENE.GHVP01021754.1~~GHVP01021754.1.p1  ORF type:complete len:460 (-),score=72.59 GHVP01021754.1:56-1408(-)